MDLSVLICTWNNSKRLAITLDSISKCVISEGLRWELVLVNNNCTDNTDEIVKKFLNKLPLIYIKEPKQGLSRARNKGLKVVQGELIIFTDDDVRPCRDWIAKYWFAYKEKPKGFFFGGPIESEFENCNFDKRLLDFAPASIRGLNWGGEPRVLTNEEYFVSANWACPLNYLKVLGGFDINKGLNSSSRKLRSGEEADIMDRLKEKGCIPWYLPEAKIIHFVPTTKCQLKYIGDKLEAIGYEEANKYLDWLEHKLFLGVPRWMYKKTFLLGNAWLRKKLFQNEGYKEYLFLRRSVGFMKGLRNINRTSIKFNALKKAKLNILKIQKPEK